MKNNGANFLIPSILFEGIYHLLLIYFYYIKKKYIKKSTIYPSMLSEWKGILSEDLLCWLSITLIVNP